MSGSTHSPSPKARAKEFLKTAHLYKLGALHTEQRHPLTRDLSTWAEQDVSRAIEALVQVDDQALQKISEQSQDILELRKSIHKVLKSGGRIFLCGCGATGRLSLSLEKLWREGVPGSDQVISFMAGGDVALVHSLEGFEDFPEFGERHLRELGFSEHDLLICMSEGGETPYVIGALEAGGKISSHAPWFVYCNPDELLSRVAERSKRLIQNPEIKKMNLSVGPMALSGSTRMQASTVIQWAVGAALLLSADETEFKQKTQGLSSLLKDNARLFLKPFIKQESAVYKDKGFVNYLVNELSITVFTDTTERAPTFSLPAFSGSGELFKAQMQPSLCHVILPKTKTSEESLTSLLGRRPRPLNWPEINSKATPDYLKGFDFSPQSVKFRDAITHSTPHEAFSIELKESTDGHELYWAFCSEERGFILPRGMSRLEVHLLLKMLLNIHSTLVMGRLGRYQGNIMTWVYPNNGKLVDRACRYILEILADQGKTMTYEETVEALFEELEIYSDRSQSLLLKVVNRLSES